MSGSSGIRLAEVTARPRSSPPLIAPAAGPESTRVISTSPAATACTAGALPLYGMCSALMPVLFFNNSVASRNEAALAL